MTDLSRLIFWTLVDLMRARATLEAEIWVLRQQINVLRRAAPEKEVLWYFDRLIFVSLYRLFPKACDALAIVKPDTIIRWHRAGFRAFGAGSRDVVVADQLYRGDTQAYPRDEHR